MGSEMCIRDRPRSTSRQRLVLELERREGPQKLEEAHVPRRPALRAALAKVGRRSTSRNGTAELREGLQGLGARQQIVDGEAVEFLLEFGQAPAWNGHRRGTVSVHTHEARRLSAGHGEIATTPLEVQKRSATDAASVPDAAERLVGGPRGRLGVALGLPDLLIII